MADYVVEKLDAAMGDLQAMLPRQWAHTGDNEVECAPNWTLYRELEDRGGLLLVIARDLGVPVGYMAAFIYPHVNATSVLTAEIKTYWVDPRHPVVLKSMISFTVGELAKRGIFKVKASTHAGHPATRIWQASGFEISDIGLTMKFRKPREQKYA